MEGKYKKYEGKSVNPSLGDTQKVPVENLLTETSYIENAPYHVMKEEQKLSGEGLEKYINTVVGNHATCQTKSCKGASFWAQN